MSGTDEVKEDFEIIVGPVPGQVGRVFTILALPESGSFTDPEHDPLLTRIQYSTEETAAAGLLNKQAPGGVHVERRSGGARRWRNIVVCLCLWMAYTLCNVAYSIIAPFFPQIAEKKGASPILIGLIISSSPICVVFLSPISGYLLPLIGVWLQVFLGLLLVGCSYTSLGFVNLISSEWSFIASCVLLRALEGVGTAILTTAIFSTFPHFFPKSVGTLVGLFELGAGFGYLLGRTLGGAMYQYGGYRLPFLSVGGAILLFVLPCTILVRKIHVVGGRKSLPTEVVCRISTDGVFISLVMVIAFASHPVSFFVPSLPTFLKDEFHQTPFLIGIPYFISSISYLIAALPVGPLTDKVGHNRQFTVCGLLMIIVAYLMMGIPYYAGLKNVWFIRVAYGIFQVGNAVSVVPIYSELLKIGRKYLRPGDSKAALSSLISGMMTSASSFSLIIAPLVGGAMSTFLPIPMCALVLAEMIGAQALVLVGVSVINKYTST